MKKTLLITGILFLLSTTVFSQDYALDKGSIIISGRFNYTVQGRDLFLSKEPRSTSLKIMPAIEYFIAPHVFVGGRLVYTYYSYYWHYYSPGSNIPTNSSSTISIGPTLGYAFGEADSQVFPYLTSGILFHSSGSELGMEIIIGGGIMIPAKEHLGIMIEAEYQFTNLQNEDGDRSSISLNVGIAGLLY